MISMSIDKIKENIGILKLYLTILLASVVTALVWLAQNIDNVSRNSAIIVVSLLLAFLIFVFIIERKIRRLINLL